MTKRKRETADEESVARGTPIRAKKQKTSTTSAAEAAPRHHEAEVSTHPTLDRRNRKHARSIAKREQEVLEDPQRIESWRKEGIETDKYHGNTGLVRKQGKGASETGSAAALKKQHQDREQSKGSVQVLNRKHKSKKKRRKDGPVQTSERTSKEKPGETAMWKVSEPLGGQMLDVDPGFSPDEKFVLVAYNNSIAVYSTSTSLLVRQLRPHSVDSVSGFAFSSKTPDHLYLSTVSGSIEKWDWIEGSRLGRWRISSSIYSLVTAKHNIDDPSSDLVYTIDRKGQGPWLISVHRLAGNENGAKTEVKTLFTTQQALSSIKVLENGRVIVATSGSQLMFGSSDEPAPSPLRDISYRWRIVECPEHIASLDIRVRPPEEMQKMSERGRLSANVIDIVVGGLKGSIHIYGSLLRKLIARDSRAAKGSSVEITSQRLHWHRNAVHAVKWSADGNYIISGGQETTLVLWQLETAHRQHLPHLGAPIESIVVSPFGTSYAIRLADNSAMILSTSELQPTFSVAGIQIPAAQQARLPLPFVPNVTVTTQKQAAVQRFRFPACASFSDPGRLLLAVPPATTSKQSSMAPPNASYLQTIDVGSAHQVSRQALTRTKVTTLNMGPESNILEEPTVTHIQTSSDGKWLASVDEWMPPKRDLESLAFDQERVLEELAFREEIYLKFWSWDADKKAWELISRMDNPHASPSGHPYDRSGVLDMVSDPSSAAFATVGEDCVVKTWKPAIRRRNGLEVKSKDGKGLRSWHCQHATPLEVSQLPTKNGLLGAKLAYSQDGSVLATGLQSSIASPIYIIDAHSGEIKSVQTGMYAGPLLGLGIVHKYVVTLSDELCVYNLVDDKLEYGIDLPACNLSPEKRLTWSHLAVDAHDLLFAVAIPQSSKRGLGSRLAIFDPANAAPQFLTYVPSPVTILVSAPGRKSFYAIDSAAQVRTITPRQSLPSVPMILPEDLEKATRGLTDLFGAGQGMLTQGGTSRDVGLTTARFDNVIAEPYVETDGPAVVSRDRLAEVFDVGPAYTLPPVTQLFEQVARLYIGKAEA